MSVEREVSKERLSRSSLVVVSDYGMDGIGGIPSSLQTYAEMWTPQLGDLNFLSYRGEKHFILEAYEAAEEISRVNPDSILLIHPTRYGLVTFYLLPDELKRRVTAYWRTRTDQPHKRKFGSTVDEISYWLRNPSRNLVTALRRSMKDYGVRHIANSESVAYSLILAGIAQEKSGISIHCPPLHPRPEREYLGFEERGVSIFNILVVSRVSSEKGLENITWLGDLVKCSKIGNWRVRVVGPITDPDYFQVLQKEINGLPIEFVGPKGWPELANYYAGSHLLFMPSRTESWGQVTIEATREGTPVLALPSPGSLEIFEETNSSLGLLADVDRTDEVVQYLNMIMDPIIWNRLSLNCVNESRRYGAEMLCQALLKDVIFRR